MVVASWGQVDINTIRSIPGSSIGGTGFPGSSSPVAFPDSTSTQDTSSQGPKGIEYHVDIPDSVLQASVFMFKRPTVQVKIIDVSHPTLTPTGAQFSDRLDALNCDYFLTVTELGHPHLSLFPSFESTPRLVYKTNIYPGLYKTPDNLTFYQVQKPYTLLSYNSSLDKDYQVHVTHTQNINERWNFALDYHLISPTGVFSNSSATDHFFDFNTNYYSRDARYQLSAGFIWQKMVLGENGGLSNEAIFINKQISNMGGVPVVATNRYSNNTDHTVFVKQTFNTVRQFEWYRPIMDKYIDTIPVNDTLHLTRFDSIQGDSVLFDTVVTTFRYEVRDTIVDYDTIQPNAPHVYNTGVLGLELQWDKQKYRSRDSILYNKLSASLFWTNDAYMDHRWHNPLKLYGGVRPEVSWLQLDDSNYTQSKVRKVALYPFARLEVSPWPAAELNVYAEAAPNLSEYNLDARLVFPFRDSLGNSAQDLTFRAVIKACNPELIYQAQTLLTSSGYTIDLKPVGVRKVEADYRHGDLLQVHLATQHIGHNVWFEQHPLPDSTTTYHFHFEVKQLSEQLLSDTTVGSTTTCSTICSTAPIRTRYVCPSSPARIPSMPTSISSTMCCTRRWDSTSATTRSIWPTATTRYWVSSTARTMSRWATISGPTSSSTSRSSVPASMSKRLTSTHSSRATLTASSPTTPPSSSVYSSASRGNSSIDVPSAHRSR